MGKRALLAAVCLLLMFACTGCWNYRGLNEISIVSGIAVDMDHDNNGFKVSFEVIDLTKDIKSGGLSSVLIESTGNTLFDAARNAKTRLEKKLYFGNTVTLFLSEEIAKSGNLLHIIDWFLRDAELRETVYMVIAQSEKASDLLKIEGINNSVIAFEIGKILSDDHSVTSSTADSMLYQIYNTLQAQGKSLTLPVLRIIMNNEKPSSEANGIAVFKDESLAGYLTPEESKYFLLITNQVQGGIITLSAHGEKVNDVSLEISENKTKKDYRIENGRLKVTVSSETTVFLAEISHEFNALDEEEITSLETAAGAVIKQRMENVIKKVQTEYKTDIFGFGNMIYQKNPKLWSQVSGNWDDGVFPELNVTVQAQVKIINSAYFKDTELEQK